MPHQGPAPIMPEPAKGGGLKLVLIFVGLGLIAFVVLWQMKIIPLPF